MGKLLFHIHSHHSYDSLNRIRKIIRFAKKNDISAIAITDHGTIKGSLEAKEYVEKHRLNIEIITGAEYYTSHGDIIALFIKEEITKTDAHKVIEEIKNQGGLVVIPHPTRNKKMTTEIMMLADIIEVFNSRSNEAQNMQAFEMTNQLNKPIIGGSDAHVYRELKNCINTFDDKLPMQEALLKTIDITVRDIVHPNQIIWSQIIKGIKNKNIRLIFQQLKSLLSINLIQPMQNTSL
jgi:predicted metal-dependent phosphoesterase TrpH